MEDEEVVREVANDILTFLGYDVVFTYDGTQTIDVYRDSLEGHNRFDAVIMDLTIPGGMGGKETITKLLEIDPEVKAIVSSGYSNDPIMANYKQYGFREMVPKPYRVQDLAEKLKEVIESPVM